MGSELYFKSGEFFCAQPTCLPRSLCAWAHLLVPFFHAPAMPGRTATLHRAPTIDSDSTPFQPAPHRPLPHCPSATPPLESRDGHATTTFPEHRPSWVTIAQSSHHHQAPCHIILFLKSTTRARPSSRRRRAIRLSQRRPFTGEHFMVSPFLHP
jgi:hypothetical protein